ncbi:hypothetical protein [Jeotgalicoccus psychrophilus]|uniref:hypothetical protein n=1 Tax=Jeotgalicoccus psychrophilus TaxID=157228 RepID=UPI000410054B|nr:hypothetical protein [Jeotgalicoccus psychrophilus]
MKYLKSGTVIGLISGTFLFIVCALIEWLTQMELMTLLLNVDFMTEMNIHTGIEILFHMIVSVMIAVLLKFIFDNFKRFYIPALVFSWIVTSLLFYALGYLSVMHIELQGLLGFTVWTIIHLCYFIIIFSLHKKGF